MYTHSEHRVVRGALAGVPLGSVGGTIWGVLSTASMAASAYHGYKRNQSLGWAAWWAFMGLVFPVVTPTIAVAQGFGKRK